MKRCGRVVHLWLVACTLATILAIGVGQSAHADERILDYHSEIEIHQDRSMRVIETIRVRAEGNQIRRGIYRDFPTIYRDRFGNRHVIDFDVTSVQRDGVAEAWFTDSMSNGTRVYIGSRDRSLPPGEYSYRIEYRTDWQLGFFETHDELWWNVNGNGWAFPIDRISARVRLPLAVGQDRLTIEGWVGRFGSTESTVSATIEDDASAFVESRRALAAGENLSFALGWPPGVIPAPAAGERALRVLANNRGLLIALVALGATLVYWLGVWSAYGRDPARGTIFPHYAPPDGVSPASARYLARMGYDRKALSAAIINLAVKGYLSITETDGDYALVRQAGGEQALAPGEAAVLARLFADSPVLTLDPANHATLQAAMAAHRGLLKRDNHRINFSTNGIYVLPAMGMLGVSIVLLLAVDGVTPAALAITIVSVILMPLFAWLMRAHTPAGRRLLDRIEGFRLYLEVAEKEALQLRNPPEITPELFEAFLPYALALGVEQRWAERFNDSLSPAQAAAYRPAWYQGHWDLGGSPLGGPIAATTVAVTNAVASSIAAASTPPGSSSGSGGGGFSGGGGGGGGGGGW